MGTTPLRIEPPMRLLVAEDDPRLRAVLVRGLEANGYFVDAVDNGADAIDFVDAYEYAVVILDWRMPRLTGIEVVERIRTAAVGTAILMLTARDAPADRVAGLDAGAHDYLVKPHELRPQLSATEFRIIEVFMLRAPAVVDRQLIAQHAWKDETQPLGSNAIDVRGSTASETCRHRSRDRDRARLRYRLAAT